MLVHAVLLFVSAVSAHPFAPQNDDYERDRRGMTWSNFMPGGGMTLWSSANDDFWSPEPERRLLPPRANDGEFWASEPTNEGDSKKNEGPVKGAEDAANGGEEAVNGADAPALRPFDDDRERRPLKPAQRPGKKGYRNHEDDDRRYSGSNASVNAWFPIMFGVLPQDQEAKTKTKLRNDEAQPGTSGSSDAYPDQPRTVTAIANSVNHATRGLANAHTVLYAGEPPASFRRMARSLFVFQ